jgi:hypothetical protein
MAFFPWAIVRTLAKSCVLLVFFFLFEIVNHGGRRGNMARALARWRHLVALHEAKDVLHWAMCIAPYCSGGMAINIVINFPAFFVIVDSIVAQNHS